MLWREVKFQCISTIVEMTWRHQTRSEGVCLDNQRSNRGEWKLARTWQPINKGASVGVVVQGAAVVEVVEREGVAIDGPLVIPFIAPAVIRIYREVIIVCFPTE